MIKSIKIEELKRISGAPLELNDLKMINYFVGENGCGKTTILIALMTMMQGVAIKNEILNSGNLVKILNDKGEEFLYQDGKPIKKDFNLPVVRVIDTFSSDLSANVNGLGIVNTQKPIFQYDLIKKKKWFDEFNTVSDLFKTPQLIVDTLVTKKLGDRDLKEETVIYKLGEKQLKDIITMSNGVKSFMKLAYLLNPLGIQDYAIVVIEEPETGLHPGIQKKFPEFIDQYCKNFPKHQIFIVTHSPFIISAAARIDNQKIYLIKDGQTCDLAKNLGQRKDGFKKDDCIGVASQMLGAGLKDLSHSSNTYESIRIIYCEGEKEDRKDSTSYQKIFPEYGGKKNIFISCGSANSAIKAFYTGKEAASLVFGNNIEILVLVDSSNSDTRTGGLNYGDKKIETGNGKVKFTDFERQNFLDFDPCFRMLRRKEIENYLFDPAILKIAFPEIDFTSEIEGRDFENGEIKDKVKASKILKDLDKLKLAEAITPNTEIYKELSECIF